MSEIWGQLLMKFFLPLLQIFLFCMAIICVVSFLGMLPIFIDSHVIELDLESWFSSLKIEPLHRLAELLHSSSNELEGETFGIALVRTLGIAIASYLCWKGSDKLGELTS